MHLSRQVSQGSCPARRGRFGDMVPSDRDAERKGRIVVAHMEVCDSRTSALASSDPTRLSATIAELDDPASRSLSQQYDFIARHQWATIYALA